MTPREDPRPPRPHWSEVLENFALTSTRGPLLSALLFRHVSLPYILGPAAKYFHRKTGSEHLAFGIMLTLVHMTTYTFTFLLFEVIEWSMWLDHYRIGRTPGQEATKEMKMAAFRDSALGWPGMVVLGALFHHILHVRLGTPSLLSPAPGLMKAFSQMAFGQFWVSACRVHREQLTTNSFSSEQHLFLLASSCPAPSLLL